MDLLINHTSDEHPWFIESRYLRWIEKKPIDEFEHPLSSFMEQVLAAEPRVAGTVPKSS